MQQIVHHLTMKFQILLASFATQVVISAVLQAIIVHLVQQECIYSSAAIYVRQNVLTSIMEMIKVKFAQHVHILANYAIIHIFVLHANQEYYTRNNALKIVLILLITISLKIHAYHVLIIA